MQVGAEMQEGVCCDAIWFFFLLYERISAEAIRLWSSSKFGTVAACWLATEEAVSHTSLGAEN